MKKYKNIVKAILFIILLFVCISLLSWALRPLTLTAAKSEPKNSLDYLVIGDSESYTSISPMELYERHGFVGYNMGKSSEYIQNSYYNLEETFKYQHPKVLFIETNYIFRERKKLKGLEESIGNFFRDLFPIFEVHDQWRKLSRDNLQHLLTTSKLKSNPAKGFHYNSAIAPYAAGEYVVETNRMRKIPAESQYYLDKIVQMANSKGTKVVLYTVPSPINWTYAMYNGVKQYADDNNLTYIDYNLKQNDLNMDWSQDTYDKGDHLNYNGALKITEDIGRFIKDSSLLDDRREDNKYIQWKEDLPAYYKLIKKL